LTGLTGLTGFFAGPDARQKKPFKIVPGTILSPPLPERANGHVLV
jgi:hypothetical protein